MASPPSVVYPEPTPRTRAASVYLERLKRSASEPARRARLEGTRATRALLDSPRFGGTRFQNSPLPERRCERGGGGAAWQHARGGGGSDRRGCSSDGLSFAR